MIQPEAGESVHTYMRRVLREVQRTGLSGVATFNNISINVYAESHIHDLLEKFSYKRQLEQALVQIEQVMSGGVRRSAIINNPRSF